MWWKCGVSKKLYLLLASFETSFTLVGNLVKQVTYSSSAGYVYTTGHPQYTGNRQQLAAWGGRIVIKSSDATKTSAALTQGVHYQTRLYDWQLSEKHTINEALKGQSPKVNQPHSTNGLALDERAGLLCQVMINP